MKLFNIFIRNSIFKVIWRHFLFTINVWAKNGEVLFFDFNLKIGLEAFFMKEVAALEVV